ncbi:hypothetical protein HAX54_050263, partial [Datura stramonium]|nr:hypothetical protein [Datura stramonium]
EMRLFGKVRTHSGVVWALFPHCRIGMDNPSDNSLYFAPLNTASTAQTTLVEWILPRFNSKIGVGFPGLH